MNYYGIKAIYNFEITRFFRTLFQSFVSPVIATSLYFVVFGAAIGSRIQEVDGVSYGTFIVPGLIMLTVITQSISNGDLPYKVTIKQRSTAQTHFQVVIYRTKSPSNRELPYRVNFKWQST